MFVFTYFYLIFEAIQLFLSKKLEHSTSPIYYQVHSLLNEMSSMNKNERVECNERGGEYTCKDASRHRRTCDVLKCSICNFYTYSSVELTYHIRKKAFFVNVMLNMERILSSLQTHSKRK